jgi:hypothetical protein
MQFFRLAFVHTGSGRPNTSLGLEVAADGNFYPLKTLSEARLRMDDEITYFPRRNVNIFLHDGMI